MIGVEELTDPLREQAEAAIEQDSMGYLNFDLRRELLSRFFPEQAAFVVLNALVINAEVWKEICPDDDAFDVAVEHAADYIAAMISEKEFQKFEAHLRYESEERINDGRFREGYILLSLDAYCNELLNDDFTPYEDELSEDSDPEMWSSLFIGALPYCGAEADIDDADPVRNRKYWTNFLNCLAETEMLDYIFPAETEEPEGSMSMRRQVARYMDVPEIAHEIEKLLGQLVLFKKLKGWKLLTVDYYKVGAKSFNLSNETGQLSSGKWIGIYHENKLVREAFDNIRKMMYAVCPEEGAWYYMRIEIGEDNSSSISFDYDERNEMLDKMSTPQEFAFDFNQFPRSAKFTPEWLDKLVKEYAKFF